MAFDAQAAAAFEHDAIKGLAHLMPAHAPSPGAAHHLGKPDDGLEQADDVGERIGHDWTHSNETRTPKRSKSGPACLSLDIPPPNMDLPMQTVLITGCSSGFGLDAARTF